MKKDLIFGLSLFVIFWFYQWLSFLGPHFSFDPFFPFLLGGMFWRLHLLLYLFLVLICGLVVDAFSSLVPGVTVIAYFVSLFIFYQFAKKLALKGFFPALISLIFTIVLCEILRLWFLPLVFELSLPVYSFYFVGKFCLFTLFWGFLCWSFCQVSFMKDVFQISIKEN